MKRITNVKKTKTTKKPRPYNNLTRSEKSNTNRQKIIQLYISMLVAKKGHDVSLEDLAQKANLSIRTLFRFFGDKKSLTQELDVYLEQYLLSAAQNLNLMSFEDYGAFLFKIFDQYEDLFKAYLYTNLGQTSRLILRKKFNQLLVDKLNLQIGRKLTEEQRKKVFLMVTFINANIWNDLKDSFSLSGGEMAQTIRWALKTLLENLDS